MREYYEERYVSASPVFMDHMGSIPAKSTQVAIRKRIDCTKTDHRFPFFHLKPDKRKS
jgi:hypothetical protein